MDFRGIPWSIFKKRKWMHAQDWQESKHIRCFNDWEKTKVDVVVSPFKIDTIPVIFQ
jgi:hypothetical protein